MQQIKIFSLLLGLVVFANKDSFCQNKAKKDTVKITVKTVGKGINSAFGDYAPVISGDGLVMLFTSKRPVTPKEKKKNKSAMEHIYMANYDEKKGKWLEAKCLSDSVNEEGRNNSAIALSKDGQTMLLYRDDEMGNGDIYQSVLRGGHWSKAEKLPETVNTEKHESSASLSPDGNTLYYVSDRKGGIGKRDIWYSTKDKDNKWGEAINMGELINTKEDEEGVFIHPDGKTLYFSSKGLPGSFGGYDIYYSSLVNNKWTTPRSLGKAINTPGDEVFIVLTADGTSGYYASEKKGGLGDKDIYQIKPLSPKINTRPKLIPFKGIVIDKETGATLPSEIEIVDNEKDEVISKISSDSSTGNFLLSIIPGKSYGIHVKEKGYLFYSDDIFIADTSSAKEISKTVPLEKIKKGNKIVLKNIFYDFDKSTLRNESETELEQLLKLMNENPSMQIELSSHTDNKGSNSYNFKLSQARAQAVVDYLINKGIAKERLVAKGYGELKPITTNDTEEGRQMNRRTEFEILND
jgi:outer membrane protein OmpA-like peptidoglycan-associated protein